ncbi:PepSY-associated TM helix domain-containing protein [Shewanella sp. 1_MG-2023]|uniref:PepSY-associated TM helix domain-containing protein n=1 Tax=unclassified Shewanella TaxID=196818 RepID=UPI0026E35720|nr:MULTISPECIES: PepSY-associated TM helix domain-containing protein [unclassified Shewanella]MDO6610613.1 PepSY-associated TM helix domain-containing protein [Shewanella sp. 7_MG-2023]MDO6770738.1 PepSY-associated TM helix domain-containing protein [Shewanella sp. 2_MG-2023]MDO6793244.1 PepSY-associated TM helix domain-containing protein [Shewanella sp. 1_MG-2023]
MRKTLFKWHSYGALIAMLPLLIISITGSILVFKVEIDSLLRPAHMVVDAESTSERVSLDTLMQTTLTANPEYELGGWELFDDKQRSDAAYVIKRGTEDWGKVYINQYSGELLSQPQAMDHYITDWLLELHYSFLLHVKGAWVGFFAALLMLFLGISGIILYRRFWAKIFTMRFNAVRRILFSDIHKFIGILSSPILLIMAFTGGYWNIAGILHEINDHGDGGHVYITAPLHSPDISFESLRQQSSQEIPTYQAGYLAMPHEPDRDISFYGAVETSNPLNSEYSSVVKFDKTTGELLSKQDIREAGFLMVFLDSFRKLHFGYFGGLLTRIIWCIVGLMPVFLGFTGLYLFWSRRKQKTAAKRSRIATEAQSAT